MFESDGFRTNLQLTSLSLRPLCDSNGKTARFGEKSVGLFERGTGVPPVNHAQDARATFKKRRIPLSVQN
jgi:hypothetical protein